MYMVKTVDLFLFPVSFLLLLFFLFKERNFFKSRQILKGSEDCRCNGSVGYDSIVSYFSIGCFPLAKLILPFSPHFVDIIVRGGKRWKGLVKGLGGQWIDSNSPPYCTISILTLGL